MDEQALREEVQMQDREGDEYGKSRIRHLHTGGGGNEEVLMLIGYSNKMRAHSREERF